MLPDLAKQLLFKTVACREKLRGAQKEGNQGTLADVTMSAFAEALTCK